MLSILTYLLTSDGSRLARKDPLRFVIGLVNISQIVEIGSILIFLHGVLYTINIVLKVLL